MKASQFYIPMRKNVDNSLIKSHQFLLRAGMIHAIGAGLYAWLPLGWRILRKIENVIAKYHDKLFSRTCMPIMHPEKLWIESGRRNSYGKETLCAVDRHEKVLIYGPSAEEVVVDCVRNYVQSAKHLPITLYNIQWKFRDEVRPRFGIMRCREFLMCDGYSFHISKEKSQKFYYQVLETYLEMFQAINLNVIPIHQNDTGEIGGDLSHEFFVRAQTGEDEIEFDEKWLADKNLTEILNMKNHDKKQQSRAIEIGHIFCLNTVYSKPMKLKATLSDNTQQNVYMGCYGVGVSRLLGAMIEIFAEQNKIVWPKGIEPFQIAVVNASYDSKNVCEKCEKIYGMLLQKYESDVYYDDRKLSISEKKVQLSLMGVPKLIIIGDKELQNEKFTYIDNSTKLRMEITDSELFNLI